MSLLPHRETTTEAKSLSDQLHLVEAFLSSVEDHESTTLGEAVSQGEEHGSLTSTRGTSKVEDLGGGKALSAESSIDRRWQ